MNLETEENSPAVAGGAKVIEFMRACLGEPDEATFERAIWAAQILRDNQPIGADAVDHEPTLQDVQRALGEISTLFSQLSNVLDALHNRIWDVVALHLPKDTPPIFDHNQFLALMLARVASAAESGARAAESPLTTLTLDDLLPRPMSPESEAKLREIYRQCRVSPEKIAEAEQASDVFVEEIEQRRDALSLLLGSFPVRKIGVPPARCKMAARLFAAEAFFAAERYGALEVPSDQDRKTKLYEWVAFFELLVSGLAPPAILEALEETEATVSEWHRNRPAPKLRPFAASTLSDPIVALSRSPIPGFERETVFLPKWFSLAKDWASSDTVDDT